MNSPAAISECDAAASEPPLRIDRGYQPAMHPAPNKQPPTPPAAMEVPRGILALKPAIGRASLGFFELVTAEVIHSLLERPTIRTAAEAQSLITDRFRRLTAAVFPGGADANPRAIVIAAARLSAMCTRMVDDLNLIAASEGIEP